MIVGAVEVGSAHPDVGLVVAGDSSEQKFRLPDCHALLPRNFRKIDVDEVGEDRRVAADLGLSGDEAVFLVLRTELKTGFVKLIFMSASTSLG